MINYNIIGLLVWLACGIISAIISKIQSINDPYIEDMALKWYLLIVIMGPSGFILNIMCIRNKRS